METIGKRAREMANDIKVRQRIHEILNQREPASSEAVRVTIHRREEEVVLRRVESS